MALWKPFRGKRAGLDTVEKHDGWIYFTTDDASLFFDYEDADGNLQRKQINAKTLTEALESSQVVHGESRTLLSSIIEDYILNINYEALAFDTSEIVIGSGVVTPDASTSSPILGQGMLGYMVLA